MHLPIHPSIYPVTNVSIPPFIHTSIHPSIYLSYPSMHFTNHSIHVFINPFIYLSTYTHPSIYPYFSPIHSILFRHFLYKSGQPKPSNDTLENIIYSPLIGSPPSLYPSICPCQLRSLKFTRSQFLNKQNTWPKILLKKFCG